MTKRDEQRVLLDAIIANPDDKKSRLVYADLLQERGDARGEFIAVQCARAELADDDPRAAELDARSTELLRKHKKKWTALGENKGARWEFRRGFVEKLSIDADQLFENADAIFAAEPIEELAIWKIDEGSNKVGGSRLAPLLGLPLQHVRRLSLARCKLVREDFEALAKAKTLGSVELLDLSNTGSYEIPVAPLAKATSLPKLRALKIGGCMIGDRQMKTLAQSKTLRFTHLIAPRNGLTSEACEAIARANWAPHLEHLDLSSNEHIGDDGVEHLSDLAVPSLFLVYVGLTREGTERARTVFGDRVQL